MIVSLTGDAETLELLTKAVNELELPNDNLEQKLSVSFDEDDFDIDEMYAKNGKDVPEFKDFNAKQFDYIKQEIIINKLFDVLKKENTIA